MKKFLMPLFGCATTLFAATPIMVSCTNPTVNCDAPKTATLSLSDKLTVNCQYTGNLDYFEVLGEDVAGGAVGAYKLVNNQYVICDEIAVNGVIENDLPAFYINKDGKFQFELSFVEGLEVGKQYQFSLIFYIIGKKNINKYIIDGFTYTVGA